MMLMRKCIINLLLLLCMIGAQAQNTTISSTVIPVSRNEAVSYAAQMYGGSDSVNYYVSESLVYASRPGSVPIIWQPSKITNGSNAIYSKNCWLVFVDLQPQAGWNHQCKYIYVPKERNANMNPLCWAIDSVCPPANIKLLPAKIQVKYQSKAPVKKVAPGSNASGGANPAAGHTYAVIISGGLVPTANKERYWNDCSFIYQTLHTTYGVPRNNIKVIMADGTDSGEDMMNDNEELVSSPLDLDGDGTDDVQYAATKANVKTVFDGLKNLGDNDHLFVFVTDHGGRDKAKNKSYIKLWKDERLYPEELDSCLNNINAGYITVLLGQCYSGGFVEDLKRTNRTILTACQENELSYGCQDIPYDEFLYRWTSAVNGCDAYGNAVDVKRDKWGHLTFKNVSRHALKNDSYTSGKFRFAEENPTYTYFAKSVAEDLSFDSIPDVVDLCFDKHVVLTELPHFNTEFPTLEVDPSEGQVGDSDSERGLVTFWHDDNIWVRNEETGDTCRDNETINFSESHPYFYVYARVRNRGVKAYSGKGSGMQYINGCWARASLLLTRDMWFGYYKDTNDKLYPGDMISPIRLDKAIAPGEYATFHKQMYVVDRDLWSPSLSMCILGYVGKQKQGDGGLATDTMNIIKVWESDKLVQNNLIRKVNYAKPLTAKIVNAFNQTNLWKVELDLGQVKDNLLEKADLSVLTNLASVQSAATRYTGSGTGSQPTFKTVRYKGSTDILSPFEMKPFEDGEVAVDCSFRADEAITERQTYDVNLILVDGQTGLRLGGETFRIVQEPRPAILPAIKVDAKNSSTATLSVDNVKEDARYEWYDDNDDLLGTGLTVNVPASARLSQYKVKVIAEKDGAFNYAETGLTGTQAIQAVESDGSQTAVVLQEATDCNVKLQLSSVSGTVPTLEYAVGKGVQTYTIPTSDLRNGVYQVSLIENGHVIDTKKFVK